MSETMLRAICLTVLTSASRLRRCLNFDRTGGALNRKSPKASKKTQSEGKLKREGATMGRKMMKSTRVTKKKSKESTTKVGPKLVAALSTLHHRVTVHRAHPTAIMGMHKQSKLTHAGNTPHFDVFYVTTLGKKGGHQYNLKTDNPFPM